MTARPSVTRAARFRVGQRVSYGPVVGGGKCITKLHERAPNGTSFRVDAGFFVGSELMCHLTKRERAE